MPQIVLEYSANIIEPVEVKSLFSKIHQVTAEIIDTDPASLKSRTIKRENFYIADGAAENAFVHLEVGLLAGRSLEKKQRLGEALLGHLESYFSESKEKLNLQITVKINDIEKATYFKYPHNSLTPQ